MTYDSIILYCRFRSGRPCCDECDYFGNKECEECCQDCCICCKGKGKGKSGQVYAEDGLMRSGGEGGGGGLVGAPSGKPLSSMVVDEPLSLNNTHTSQQGPGLGQGQGQGRGPGYPGVGDVDLKAGGEGSQWPSASIKNSNNNSANNSTNNTKNHPLPASVTSTMTGSTFTQMTTSSLNQGGSLGSTSMMGQRINITGGQFLPTIEWSDISPTVKIGAGAFSAVYRGKSPSHTSNPHILSTHPVNPLYHPTLSTQTFYPLHQPTLSTHSLQPLTPQFNPPSTPAPPPPEQVPGGEGSICTAIP